MKTITLHARSTIHVYGPYGAPWVMEANEGDGLVAFASAAHQRAGGSKLVELDKLVAALREEADTERFRKYSTHADACRDIADRLARGELL